MDGVRRSGGEAPRINKAERSEPSAPSSKPEKNEPQRQTGYSMKDTFEPARAAGGAGVQLQSQSTSAVASSKPPPPPLPPNATPEQAKEHEGKWQEYTRQFETNGHAELDRKRTAYPFPDPAADQLRAAGKFEGPYVAGRSLVPGNENTPAFFTNFPNDKGELQMQIYSYVRPANADPTKRENWHSFEIYGDVLKAYDDPKFTGDKRGTNSALGFPTSGREDAVKTQAPFLKDSGVQELLAQQRAQGKPESLPYQSFQGGFLVDMGGGKVQGFKLDGTRLGTGFPEGTLATNVAPTGPGSAKQPGSVYAPFQVTDGVEVNSRLGFSWPNSLGDGRPFPPEEADKIIAKAKEMGAGYTTLVLPPGSEVVQKDLIKKLIDNGITPLARLYTAKEPDQWGPADFDQMAQQSKNLVDQGVKLIQVGNEPNLTGESKLRREDGSLRMSPQEYIQKSSEQQARAMLAIREKVGDGVKLGPPPVAAGSPDEFSANPPFHGNQAPQTYFPVLMQEMAKLEKSSGRKLVDWIPTHNYTNIDGQEFTNQVGGGGARGQLGFGPMANKWYEAEAAKALGRDVKSLSTEGGAGPNAFRTEGQAGRDRVRTEMRETLAQLNGDSSLTANLWLLYESDPKGKPDQWDRFALSDQNGPGAFADGLEDYRNARRAAE